MPVFDSVLFYTGHFRRDRTAHFLWLRIRAFLRRGRGGSGLFNLLRDDVFVCFSLESYT